MLCQRWTVGFGMVLVLFLVEAGRADEASALKAVDKIGGRVSVDGKAYVEVSQLAGDKPVVGVTFDGIKVTSAAIKELKEFKGLKSLDLSYSQITDKDMVTVYKDLKQLEWLSLKGVNGV